MTRSKPPERLMAIPATEPGALAQATAILARGGTVAVPTETVYGLAARADDDNAVAAIYRAKGRPDFNPLIVHVPDLAAATERAHFGPAALRLAEAFWPGPLTLVLPRRDDAGLAAAVSAGLPTIALRCPAHPVMHALLVACGFPLAAPSANRSGAVSPTEAAHVAQSLGERIDLILDGGPCAAGLESTIVAIRESGDWAILRPGPITHDRIASLLGPAHEETPDSSTGIKAPGRIEAPGQLTSHYAPGKPVRLGATEAGADEFLIGFGAIAGDVTLSASGDLAQAAARLYACLHAAAASDRPRVAVAPVPAEGIGAAINDRLRRAAA